MKSLTFGSLFAGIGGFDLGFERAGMVCKWQVEIDPFCQNVLAKHWPDVERFEDVRTVGKHNLQSVDVICGGFPCQPHSLAGQRKGANDDRDLWPEYRRIIDDLRPAWVVGENVPGIKTTILDQVLSDLESLNYTCQTFIIPACAVNAPHRRDRVFIVAYATSGGQTRTGGNSKYAWANGETRGIGILAYTNGLNGRARARRQNGAKINHDNWWAVEPGVGRVAYGVPNRVDRLRSLGNAVVPQIAEFIGRLIVDAHSLDIPENIADVARETSAT